MKCFTIFFALVCEEFVFLFMQSATAKKLRQDWGAAFCFHPIFDKEYDSTEYTGNHVCLICGKSLSEEEYKDFCKTKETNEKLLNSEQK